MIANPELLNHNSSLDRTWMHMVGLSVLCHVLFFFGAVFLPDLSMDRTDFPASIEIDLVGLPPVAGPAQKAGGPKAPPAQQEPVPEVKKSPVPEPRETRPEPEKAPPEKVVSLAPQKPVPVKQSLKKKTFDPSDAINKAIAKLEQKVPESRPQTVLQAIEALRKKEEAAGAGGTGTGAGSGAGAATGASAGYGPGGTARRQLELLDIYNAEIWDRIRRNWAFSQEMTGNRESLEAVVIVKIMRDGEIRDIWFEKRAGDSYFDDSVLKAVKKSNPLPPLPEGFLKPYYEVGFRFNLSELRNNL
jgi:colicin import membrane protein